MEYNRKYYFFSFIYTYFNFNFNVIYYGEYKMKCYLNVLNFILLKNYNTVKVIFLFIIFCNIYSFDIIIISK